jgi:hypothetical protein
MGPLGGELGAAQVVALDPARFRGRRPRGEGVPARGSGMCAGQVTVTHGV